MITVSRQLLRQFRAVWRRACGPARGSALKSRIRLAADRSGLRIQAATHQIAIEVYEPGSYPADQLDVPVELLMAAEGRSHDEVLLEQQVPGKLLASWTECGIPQLRTYEAAEAAEDGPDFPKVAGTLVENPPQLMAALRDAAAVAGPDSSRFALNQIQLRGSTGQILATDGWQLLAQAGFQFPWSDNPLVPASKVFASSELAGAGSVAVGATADWMTVRSGNWTVWLKLDRDGRFPQVDDVIPKPATALARLEIAPADARFLARTLHHLPDDQGHNRPITLDLNGKVLLRAQALSDPHPTELVLSRSKLIGQPIAVSTDRQFLARAIQLGFRQVCLFGGAAPALCDDGQRQYVWAVLDPDARIRACEKANRIESSPYEASGPLSRPRRRSKEFQSVG